MIAIIDYQMGNLRSVQKAFESQGFDTCVTDDADVMMDANGVVLPGVGAFGDCYRELRSRGLVDRLLEWIDSGRPFLGICLGLQILLTRSEESRRAPGLDVISGQVKRFPAGELKVPHLGWNRVMYSHDDDNGKTDGSACPLFAGIPEGSYFYFVHSYYVAPDDPTVAAGTTDYGVRFTSAVWRGNIFATQFHPEKSQQAGLKLIQNFGTLAEKAAHHAQTETGEK